MLVGLITRAFEAIEIDDSPHRILEVGAGDGSLTGHLLDHGFEVTATEISEHSAKTLEAQYGMNADFSVVHDPDGNLSALGNRTFGGVLFASVLHHIPDYSSTLETMMKRHLEPGGSLVSVQDPLWYRRCSKVTRLISEFSYLSWRITQGNLMRGLSTRLRHIRGDLSEELPGDSVEYHVVRNGVDELAIKAQLCNRFDRVNITSYWSSQGATQQWIGDRLGLLNTFAISATGFSR